MTATAPRRSFAPPPRYRWILAATAVAAAVSAGLNTVVRQAAVTVFEIPQPQFEPLNLNPVVVSSVVSAVAGGAFFALLTRLTRRPVRAFAPAAAVVLALSMIPVVMLSLAEPPRYEGAGPAAGAALALMRVVVAVVLLLALRWTHRSAGDGRTPA